MVQASQKYISIQSHLHSIEYYIDVSSRSGLPPTSLKYLQEFSKMNNDDDMEKMFEKESSPKFDDNNHFVMYYGNDNKDIMVHENWFESRS